MNSAIYNVLLVEDVLCSFACFIRATLVKISFEFFTLATHKLLKDRSIRMVYFLIFLGNTKPVFPVYYTKAIRVWSIIIIQQIT